jgi:hypothetical protein
MSKTVFANMQAKFRDAVRLESETSSLETEKQIAESRYAQREQLALREQELLRREADRKAELDRIAATAAAELEALKRTQRKEATIADFTNQTETAGAEALKKKEVFRLEEQVIAAERAVQEKRFEADKERKEHQVRVSEMDEIMSRRRIETTNVEDVKLALVNNLPAIAGALQIKELNITDDTLGRLGRALTDLLTRPAQP